MIKGIDMQTPFRLAHEEHGAELVEFALAASLLALVLFGVFQWMFAMYAYHFTNFAAQQGARLPRKAEIPSCASAARAFIDMTSLA